MEQCPGCKTFLVSCPCCEESFCPDCGIPEGALETMVEEGDFED
ncbi:hypothetical protein [Bacillus sp. 3103sda1]|nr:hypothetical protein [Bacillus sp. 3103sda1]